MNKFNKHGLIFRSTSMALLFFISSSVWAGTSATSGTLVYAPAATSVPTLSGMMLVILALLLATIAFRVSRQTNHNSGRMMVLSLISIGALASGMGGIKLISDVNASGSASLIMVGGGSLPIEINQLNTFTNQTGIKQTIISVTFDSPSDCPAYPAGNANECTQGKILADTQQCTVDCSSGGT